MAPATRSAVMAKIRGKGTRPERMLEAAFLTLGLAWDAHTGDLVGRPDFVFRQSRVLVFVDGDFWHGFQFNLWRDKLSESWEAKIAATRRRDRRNTKALRALDWHVFRVWEHEIDADAVRVATRIARVVVAREAALIQPGVRAQNLVATKDATEDG